jgi:hypothetical protein
MIAIGEFPRKFLRTSVELCRSRGNRRVSGANTAATFDSLSKEFPNVSAIRENGHLFAFVTARAGRLPAPIHTDKTADLEA